MCGLCGEFRWDGTAADTAAVGRMRDPLAPRGPNGTGLWAHGPAALGHRRLAIIDLSEAGAQPMVDSDLGLSVAFNGCIYNYPALRAELMPQGYHFFSTSDTEVVLKAYHRWGTRCVEHFAGMFAFAIVERGYRPARAGARPARDQAALSRGVAGAAAVRVDPCRRSWRPAEIDTSLDPVALHHYLSFHSVVPAPRTILSGRAQAAAGDRAGRRSRRPHDR